MGCCCRINKKVKVQDNQEFNAVVNSHLEQKSLPLNGRSRKVIRNDISQDIENDHLKANNETEEYTEVNKLNIQDSVIKNDQQLESNNDKVQDNQVKLNQEISKSFQNHNIQDNQEQLPSKNQQTLNSNIQKEQENVIQEKELSSKEVLKNNYMSISLPPQTQPHRSDQILESSQTYILQKQKSKEENKNEEPFIPQQQPNKDDQQAKFNLGTNEYNLVMQKPDYENNSLIHNLASRSLPPLKYQREQSIQNALSERDQENMCRKSQTDILNKKIELNYQTWTESIQQRSGIVSQPISNNLDFSRGEADICSQVNSDFQVSQSPIKESIQIQNQEISYSNSSQNNVIDSSIQRQQYQNGLPQESQANKKTSHLIKSISYQNIPPQSQQIAHRIMDMNFKDKDQFISQIDLVKNQNALYDFHNKGNFQSKFFTYKVQPPQILMFDIQSKEMQDFQISEVTQFPRHARLVFVNEFQKVFILGGSIKQPPKHQPLDTIYQFSLKKKKLKAITPMPSSHMGGCVLAYKEFIFIIGGINAQKKFSEAVERYSVVKKE